MPGIYGEDTRSIAFDGSAGLPALRMQGCPAIKTPGHSGVDHLTAPSPAAVPLPAMQRAARRFFLPPKTSEGFRNRSRERNRLTKDQTTRGDGLCRKPREAGGSKRARNPSLGPTKNSRECSD